MLVLTRRLGESIVIDGQITVRIVAVVGDKVRLGITAPDDVRVDREEVHARRQENWGEGQEQPASQEQNAGS